MPNKQTNSTHGVASYTSIVIVSLSGINDDQNEEVEEVI